MPGGAATTHVHDRLALDDRVTLKGPMGRFFIRESQEAPVLLLAGGSGLSSPRSMVLDLLERGFPHPITLVQGQRTRAELYYHEDFLALAEAHGGFTYLAALSDEPGDTSWTGFRGYVHEAAQAHFNGDFNGQRAYLCGPPLMVEACIGALMGGRLFERDIYLEKFISAADAQQVRSPLFKRI